MSVIRNWFQSIQNWWKRRGSTPEMSADAPDLRSDASPLLAGNGEGAPIRVFAGVASAETIEEEDAPAGEMDKIIEEVTSAPSKKEEKQKKKEKKKKTSFFASLREKILYDDLDEDDAILEPPPPRKKRGKKEETEAEPEPVVEETVASVVEETQAEPEPAAPVKETEPSPEKPQTPKADAPKEKPSKEKESPRPADGKDSKIPDVLLRNPPPKAPQSEPVAEEVIVVAPAQAMDTTPPAEPVIASAQAEPEPEPEAFIAQATVDVPAQPEETAAETVVSHSAPIQRTRIVKAFDITPEPEETLSSPLEDRAAEEVLRQLQQEDDIQATGTAAQADEAPSTAETDMPAAPAPQADIVQAQAADAVIILPPVGPTPPPQAVFQSALLMEPEPFYGMKDIVETPAIAEAADAPQQSSAMAPAAQPPASAEAPVVVVPDNTIKVIVRRPRKQSAQVVRYVSQPQVKPIFVEAKPKQAGMMRGKPGQRRKATPVPAEKKSRGKKW